MNTEAQIAQGVRVITVVSTKGGTLKKFEQNLENRELTIKENGKENKVLPMNDLISTWGVLKDVLVKDGYSIDKLVAVENVNKHTLEHIDATLPEGDFRLFLRPKQTKAGSDVDSMGFKQLRELVKNDEEGKKFFSSFVAGKNWTQLTTPELKEGIKKYQETKGTTVAETVTETSAEAVVEVETEEGTKKVEMNALGKIKLAQSLLEEAFAEVDNNDDILDDTFDELESRFEIIQDEIAPIETILSEFYNADGEVVTPVETAEEEAYRKEQEEIAREMRELEEGL